MRQSALKQEVASFRDLLSLAVSTSIIKVGSRLALVREESAVANGTIGTVRGEVKTGREEMDLQHPAGLRLVFQSCR